LTGIQQKHWRIGGLLCLGGCAALAYGGTVIAWPTWPVWAMLTYWGLFLLLLLLTFYTALLDIRFIRAEYAVMKRELFKQTLGDEELRKALIEGERRERERARQARGAGGEPSEDNSPDSRT
jgi:TRAP-type C4-dicarboxylate transport system permease small subunit